MWRQQNEVDGIPTDANASHNQQFQKWNLKKNDSRDVIVAPVEGETNCYPKEEDQESSRCSHHSSGTSLQLQTEAKWLFSLQENAFRVLYSTVLTNAACLKSTRLTQCDNFSFQEESYKDNELPPPAYYYCSS